MDSTLSATDSATMRNSPLCPSTVIPFLEDKVPARLDEIKNQIVSCDAPLLLTLPLTVVKKHDDMNHIGKGIGTLKAIAVDLGMVCVCRRLLRITTDPN